MSFFEELKKLTHPYEEDEDVFPDDDEMPEELENEPAPARFERPKLNPFATFMGSSNSESEDETPTPPRPARIKEGRVVNLGTAGNRMQVVLVRPERFETAAEIADHLREKHAVLVNLETTPKDVTRRLVDFLSGAAYVMDGKVKKISANTYIITPPSVNLMGDMMDELETTGIYF